MTRLPAPQAENDDQRCMTRSQRRNQPEPPSLPMSPPESPETAALSMHKQLRGVELGTGGRDKSNVGAFLEKGSSSQVGAGQERKTRVEYVADGLPERYRDRRSEPILTKAKVAFPSARLSEEVTVAPTVGSKATASMGRTEGRRLVSQTTTTSTTRRTERRSVRYSLPAFDNAFEDYPAPPSPSHSSSRSQRHRSSSSCAAARTRSPSSSSSATARTRSPSAKPRKATTSSPHHHSHSRSSRTPLSAHRSSSMADPTAIPSSRSSGPASSSPFFARSFGGGSGLAVRRRSSSTASAYAPNELDTDAAAFASALTFQSMPFVRPFVSAFAFLAVSAVAALAVSTVLLASFSLTFYDDCTQRISSMQRSLGGVRAGMRRLIGNAKGALEIAVRATVNNSMMTSPGVEEMGEGGEARGRTAMPTVQQDDSDGEVSTTVVDDQQDEQQSQRDRNGQSRSRKSSGASTPTSASSCGRLFGGFSSPLRAFTSASPPSPSVSPGHDRTADRETCWNTDDDAQPYDVPPCTPRASRSSSPFRDRSSRASPSSGAGGGKRPGPPLPPRPSWTVLIPSVIFALLFTLAKLLFRALKGRQGEGTRSDR
ncbi:hypothetical protein JCM11641_008120 [Rhodosporidiobolus odoratus]